MLLAIDTSAGTAVAVVDLDGEVRSERFETEPMRHAEVVGRLIHEALEAAGCTPRDISTVAVGMGPGPFTGLRVGIAAARAFAFGRGIPTRPVVSHDAVALDALEHGHAADFVVVSDARRRELYWSAYAGLDADGLPTRVDGPGLAKPAELPHPERARLVAESVSAAHLGRVAARAIAAGRAAAADEPLYLRSPDVTLSAGPKRVTG
ncbi:tRNA (adenosine(37)-N6)-threonylcarbamoyltransferase complex dimerization subunit type 1 TsaB [Microbacteriaceae bacterium VKM Ac-2854]|nr:tRNA (adenosine(37)-N6)-threonylcarbamoyltransferase complex dimerization subunit type 1 TsaB [Microbacteriaceae bacterium VKM Ac-2854]